MMWNGYLHVGYKNMTRFVLSVTILCGKLEFFILLTNWNVRHLSYFVWGEGKHAPVGRYNTRCHSAVGQVIIVQWTHWLKNCHSSFTSSDVLSSYHFASLDAAEFWSWEFSSELSDLLDSRQRKICFAVQCCKTVCFAVQCYQSILLHYDKAVCSVKHNT